ncbi:MAG TPA: hypothetical protein VN495_01935 [Candidatus Paceibacterota bacterium]|nr:hypothetical protein [Candidatus Paceibacterota bacterium]
MRSRPLIWIGMIVGSTIGSFIPDLWGAGIFSISSIILGGAGACAGMYLGFKLSDF